MWTRILATGLACAMVSGTLIAQERVPADGGWIAVAQALGPGAFVAIRTKDGDRLKGTLIQSSADAIRVQPRTRIPVAVRDIAYTDIDFLERTRKPGMSPGAKVVLGVGIGAGVALLASALIVAAAFGY
jgi:hypothetical protein